MDWVLVRFFEVMMALGHTKESLTDLGFFRIQSDEAAWNKARFEASISARRAEGYYGSEIGASAPLPPELLEEILGGKF